MTCGNCAELETALGVRNDEVTGLAGQLEEARADARRWRYARQFLAIEDIEAWATEMRGHQPDEAESAKADAAIDRLTEGHNQCHSQEKP